MKASYTMLSVAIRTIQIYESTSINMENQMSTPELYEQLDNLEKRLDLLHQQLRALTLVFEEHQKLHRRILTMDSELTEDDLINMVGAPFLKKNK